MIYLKKLITVCSSGQEVSLGDDEVDKVLQFYNDIRSGSEIVYRGANGEMISAPFLVDDFYSGNLLEVAKKIFYFGEKAKACLKSTPKYLSSLKEITLNELLYILTEVKNSLDGNFCRKETFKEQNPEFFNFFSSEKNKDHLTKLFVSLDNSNKIKLRNMLVSFLHTHGKTKFKSESVLVSTSTNFDTSTYFVRGRVNGRVLIAWLPQPEYFYAIRSNPPEEYYSELERIGIPTIKIPIYPGEFEISVIGAIFPHYIFGVFDIASETTIVNYNILAQSKNNQQCAKHGLTIDQSTFKKQLKEQTKYLNGIEARNNEINFYK